MDIEYRPQLIKKRRSVLDVVKNIIFEDEKMTENDLRNMMPNMIAPRREKLMKIINVTSKRLVDIFKFTLTYKKISSGGMQFYGMRKYTPEDDASKIDWKTSVRMSGGHKKIDELYIKMYEEEMDLQTFIILDTSNTMLFGTKKNLKSDLAALVAATLSYAANTAKTRYGILLINDNIAAIHPPKKGSQQFTRIINSICDPKCYWGMCNMEFALKNALELLEPRTLLVIISDFIDLKGNWVKTLRQCASKYDSVLGVMIRDTLDTAIPEGLGSMRVSHPFFKKNTTEVNFDMIREKYNEMAKEEEESIKKIFGSAGAGFVKLTPENDDFIRSFLRYFSVWAGGG